VQTRPPAPPITSFAAAGLPQRLVTALERRGIHEPFPVQAATLPDALTGADLLGRAVTGSGKTLGFGLPLLAHLGAAGPRGRRRPKGLVLAPTRELAQQVTDVLAPLGQALGVRVAAVYGGTSIGRQINALDRGVDVVVATPGRLVDLLERRAIFLDAVEVTVVDEADHMCDLGFLPVVRRLLGLVPTGGQRLLFSATLDGDVDVLTREFLVNPVLVEVMPPDDGAVVTHRVLTLADRAAKTAAVAELAATAERTLLFVRTKRGADRLARQLSTPSLPVKPLHGGLTQSARTRALAAFGAGRTRVLVATDVAARGLDISNVDVVVHVDPPSDPKAFVHRSGRTGRAGASGAVITLALPDERREVDAMLARAGITVAGERSAQPAPARGDRRPRSARDHRQQSPRDNRQQSPRDSRQQSPRDSRQQSPRDHGQGSPRGRRRRPQTGHRQSGAPRSAGRRG
jgi:superfamily II DNA/RNA helicase